MIEPMMGLSLLVWLLVIAGLVLLLLGGVVWLTGVPLARARAAATQRGAGLGAVGAACAAGARPGGGGVGPAAPDGRTGPVGVDGAAARRPITPVARPRARPCRTPSRARSTTSAPTPSPRAALTSASLAGFRVDGATGKLTYVASTPTSCQTKRPHPPPGQVHRPPWCQRQ